MDIKGNIKSVIFKICIIFLSLCTLIWFSIFSYGILYYLYIPAVAHIKPVHLQYDMFCIKGKICKHPFDNITLIEVGEYEFFRGGQGYAIEVVLEMPESERNLNQGMFMVRLDMLDNIGAVIKSSHRPALLRYRSYLFKMMYTLVFMPGLLAGSLEEKQSLTIPLFEKYVEDSYRHAHFAYIEVQAQTAEIYTSTLRIHAQFTGLRYLMYYWPVTSAVVGMGSHFLFLLTTIILIWLRETVKNSETNKEPDLWQSTSTKKDVRRQPKKRQYQKSVGFMRDRTPEKKIDLPSRIKKEKIEIENLPTSRDSCSKHHKESNIEKQDDMNEEYFDAEHGDIPGVIPSVPDDVQPTSLRQRITSF